MKKRNLVLLTLLLFLNCLSFGDEYISIWSKNEDLTTTMLKIYNQDLIDYGKIKYLNHDMYKNINWSQKENALVTNVDIDNNKNSEKVSKVKLYSNGYITDVLKFSIDNTIINIGEFADNTYELINLPKNGNEFNYMAGTFEINPFIFQDNTYISIESRYGNREFLIICEYKNKQLLEIGYYIKLYNKKDYGKDKVNINNVYEKALKEYRTSKNPRKAIKIMEEEGEIAKILRNKRENISKGKYIRILNDYAYFLSETNDRYGEAIPILKDVISLSPKRAVAYINLGDIYMKIAEETNNEDARKIGIYCYQNYVKLLKENANISTRVKNTLTSNQNIIDVDISNKSKLSLENEVTLVMSRDNDISQQVLTILNNEMKKYGNVKYQSPEFNKHEWENTEVSYNFPDGTKSGHKAKLSYFDINNDGKIEIVEKMRPFIGDFYFDGIEFYENSEFNRKYIKFRGGEEINSPKTLGGIPTAIDFLDAEYLPYKVYVFSSSNIKYKLKYSFSISEIYPITIKKNTYLILEERNILGRFFILIKLGNGYKRNKDGKYPHIEQIAYYINKIR